MKALYVQSGNGIFTNIGGEVVILNTETNNYYSLNKVGTFIWKKMERQITLEELTEITAIHYQVDPSICQKDIEEILEELILQHLVKKIIEY